MIKKPGPTALTLGSSDERKYALPLSKYALSLSKYALPLSKYALSLSKYAWAILI
ncbi:MAG: hypothetical protein GDA48_10250 [Hormoscilla sp. GM102CHS1]|nr:hypothetical protein [Hormoscilla sp. GM102CHS1]